jgi:hypothetical protein
MCSEWSIGASSAACSACATPRGPWIARSANSTLHWSCWSPPGVPNASHGLPSRSASDGESVVRGRAPGSSVLGRPGCSQNI